MRLRLRAYTPSQQKEYYPLHSRGLNNGYGFGTSIRTNSAQPAFAQMRGHAYSSDSIDRVPVRVGEVSYTISLLDVERGDKRLHLHAIYYSRLSRCRD